MTTLHPETLDRLRGVSTATLTTQLFKRGLRNTWMRGVRPLAATGTTLVGPAFTLRTIPAREDLDRLETLADPEHPQRKAIEVTPAGHVLVIDCRGVTDAAAAGDILVTRLARRGVAGLVCDGALRDAGPIAAMGFAAFCAGPAAPLSLCAHHAVALQEPIACGGVAVFPGDVIVGDADGVVVIPAGLADAVAADGAEQEALERFVLERIGAGAALPGTYPPDAAVKAEFAAWRARGER